MSNIRLLFDNGSYYSVMCSLWPPKPGNPRPAEAFIVSESEGDFTLAARTAALAAYTCLESRGEKISPFTAGIELLERINAKANIAGESGGLCFAIAIAAALLKVDMPDIAATGVLTADGSIKKVKGLHTKLTTAAKLVSENGFIFYPRINGNEISDDLWSVFKQKNLRCHGVTHINQVFDILLPPQQTTGTLKKIILLILALILTGLVGYFCLSTTDMGLTSLETKITKPMPLSPAADPSPLIKKPKPSLPKPIKLPPVKIEPIDTGFD
ncbi:S16 family serine protease [Desulfobacula phenolica]|uniref:Lon protease (S16) C-terminal proteolytic domain-containing protein n=1 Tax=Desulfobacula phenolica TaxID=90732 RepID=A0A1H2JM16_9BACT|nr:S16 family serine protease [Desulfobacula phenolica]SDU57176.1 Lon protease (S16) C-terminal proteolytic domain-containing protein [Desulfobacula phenolica]